MKETCSVPRTALTNPNTLDRLGVKTAVSSLVHPDKFVKPTSSPLVHPDKLANQAASATAAAIAKAGAKGPSSTGTSSGSGSAQGQEASNGELTYTLEGPIKRVDYGHCVITAGDVSFKMSVSAYTGATAAVPRHIITFGAEWLVLAGNQPYSVALQGTVLDCTAAQVFEDFDNFVKTAGRTQYDKYHQPVVPEKAATLEIQGTTYKGIYTNFHWSKAAQQDMTYQVSVSFIGIVAERTAQKTPQNKMSAAETPPPYGTASAKERAETAASGYPGAWNRVLDSQTAQFPDEPTGEFTPSTFEPTQYPGWAGYAAAAMGGATAGRDGLAYKPSGDYAYSKPSVHPAARPAVVDPEDHSVAHQRLAVETRDSAPVSVPTSWSQVYDGTRVRSYTETGTTTKPSFADTASQLYAQRGMSTIHDYFPDPGYKFHDADAQTTVRVNGVANVSAYSGSGQTTPALGYASPRQERPTEFSGSLEKAIRS